MYNEKEKRNEYFNRISAMPEKTAEQRIRKSTCLRYLDNIKDDGRYGRIDEIMSAGERSKKDHVSYQGEADLKVTFIRNGKRIQKPVERKTNGGRISALIDELDADKNPIIIYSLDICNSTTKGKRRQADPIIINFEEFLNMLFEINALKQTNGKKDETAIQPSKKELYERVLAYPHKYIAGKSYDYDTIMSATI